MTGDALPIFHGTVFGVLAIMTTKVMTIITAARITSIITPWRFVKLDFTAEV